MKRQNILLFDEIQENIHRLMDFFFSGYNISLINRLIYPHVLYFPKDIAAIINQIDSSLSRLGQTPDIAKNKQFMQFFNCIQKNKSKYFFSCRRIARIISVYYLFFENCSPLLQNKTKCRHIKVKTYFDKKAYPSQDLIYLNPLFNLQKFANKYLAEYLVDYILHGSLSTKDYIRGHSDVDTFVIIKKGSVTNTKKLLNLRTLLCRATKYFYFIDPFQHHSHFFITEQDMQYYPQHFFPLLLFNYSSSIYKTNKFIFYERNSNIERRKKLLDFVNVFKKFADPQAYPNTRYSLKYLIQIIILFPCVYFQSLENYTYKKTSFKKISKMIPDDSYTLMKRISEIRNKNLFGSPVEMPLFLQELFALFPNPLIWPFLYRLFHRRIPRGVNRLIKNDLPAQVSALLNFLIGEKIE